MSKTFWDGMNRSLEQAVEPYNYSDSINIVVSKVRSNGVFTHWESDVYDQTLRVVSQCTGPTYMGVVDEALRYIYDEYPEWIEEDANE
jgi:hypothetical protein